MIGQAVSKEKYVTGHEVSSKQCGDIILQKPSYGLINKGKSFIL